MATGATNGKASAASAAAVQLAQSQMREIVGPTKAAVFDPLRFNQAAEKVASDPVWNAYHFRWRDTQQLGRLAVDAMLHHAAVSTPYDFLVAFLKSYKPLFKPQVQDPTERQKKFADFANAQIRRLVLSGDARQGWTRVMDWFAQGLRYGFSLAEMETEIAPYGGNGQTAIQCRRIIALPQATLDTGYVPLEEFGQALMSGVSDRRYRCFDMDGKGNIDAYIQFNGRTDQDRIEWRGEERLRILHYVHRGGESSPYGQPLGFAAFYHWSDLYTLELLESAMLDAGLPFLGISYKAPDGVPSPALNQQVVDSIQKQDTQGRVLVVPNATFTSVAPSNPSFTDHASRKKKELRRYITQSMLVPTSLYSETEDSQSDAKALMALTFKHVFPSILAEFSDVMTGQFAKRLIDSNWSRINEEDYPALTFNTMLDEDLRAATPLLQMLLPYLGADRLGEAAALVVPGFSPDWIPKDHADSNSVKRPVKVATDKEGGAKDGSDGAPPSGGGSPATPGGKAPGTSESNKSL